ncbi:rhamnulokinase [Bacillus sp. D386]|uniref:rhamnulokinase n=1 Tax=Bacillus sp. D386 TaxID=2587155 RepID=UPI00111ED322|nr:rhamnulokinase [Bacillus sp. D386]
MPYIAVDIGASSGRLVMGEIINQKLEIKEIHRFANGFMEKDGFYRWDIDHLLTEIVKGLAVVKEKGYDNCIVGIDTWAVDYVLVDQKGKRLQEVISYRDNRTENTIEKVTKMIPKKSIYNKTGIQFQNFNTFYQLYEEEDKMLEQTKYILMVPDYLGYCLTGKAVTEVTNASTTQLLNVHTGDFDEELLQILRINKEQFPPLVQPGYILGDLQKEKFPEYNLPDCKVITVATHDTASAVLGTPGESNNWAYLSSGTWSLLGMELPEPVVSESAYKHNYTNEWGGFHTTRFLKNIIGMWLIQEVRRLLPVNYTFAEFVEEARIVESYEPYINFNDDRFMNPKNMIEEIQEYCRETDQRIPETAGELASCIYINLAIVYSIALDELEEITGKKIDCIHIVGGGAHNELLNQLTANMSGRQVFAGPTEATAVGNLIIQMIAIGELKSMDVARQFIRESFEIKEYRSEPVDRERLLNKFKEVTSDERKNQTELFIG